MDYKQKYERDLEKAKVINPGTADYEVAVKVFPELKDSEDERIRKEILDCFKTMKRQGCFPSKHKEQYDSWIAWLEKQGEKVNPYSGISFEYNGHTWGMCARDNGVDILLDKQLFKHLEKQGEQKLADKIGLKISTKVTDAPVASPSNYRFRTITIDGCEYLMYDNRMIVHKGNCKFCEQRRKAETERLFNKTNMK